MRIQSEAEYARSKAGVSPATQWRREAEVWFDGSVESVDRRLGLCQRLLTAARGRLGAGGFSNSSLDGVAELEQQLTVLSGLRRDLLTAASDREESITNFDHRHPDDRWERPDPKLHEMPNYQKDGQRREAAPHSQGKGGLDEFFSQFDERGNDDWAREDEKSPAPKHEQAHPGGERVLPWREQDWEDAPWKNGRLSPADRRFVELEANARDDFGRHKDPWGEFGVKSNEGTRVKYPPELEEAHPGSSEFFPWKDELRLKREPGEEGEGGRHALSSYDRRFVDLEAAKFARAHRVPLDELQTRAANFAQEATSTLPRARSRAITAAFVRKVSTLYRPPVRTAAARPSNQDFPPELMFI